MLLHAPAEVVAFGQATVAEAQFPPDTRKSLSVEKRRPPSPVTPDNQKRLRDVAPIVILATKALILHFVE
jgi:hypothetical protein